MPRLRGSGHEQRTRRSVMGGTPTRRRMTLLAAAVAAAAVLVPAATAGAAATCSFSNATATVTVTLTGLQSATRSRTAGGAIQLEAANCGAATVANTDTINVAGDSGGQAIRLDLANGGFAPGKTAE